MNLTRTDRIKLSVIFRIMDSIPISYTYKQPIIREVKKLLTTKNK